MVGREVRRPLLKDAGREPYLLAMVEPGNHTLVLLRETRAEMREELARVHEEFAKVRAEMDSASAEVSKRLDAVHLNGMKALKSFIGHRARVERALARFDDQVSMPEVRAKALEEARS